MYSFLGEVFLVSCEETISAWSECSNNKGHQDQNCYGSQNRTITTITYTFFGQTVSVETETKQCLLTLGMQICLLYKINPHT